MVIFLQLLIIYIDNIRVDSQGMKYNCISKRINPDYILMNLYFWS